MLKTIKDRLDSAVDAILAVMLASLAVIVFVQVVFRYLLNNALSWPEETARLLVVWLSYLGAYMALRHKKHVGFTLLVKKLPVSVQGIVGVVNSVLMLTFVALIIVEGWRFMAASITTHMPYTGLSYGLFAYSVFPVSGLLMALQLISDIVMAIRNPAEALSGQED